MGISFNPKEMMGSIINGIASAFVLARGGTSELAVLIGSVLESCINGFHFDRSSTVKMKQAIQYALSSALDNFDILDSCSRALKDELISEQNIKDYLESNDQFGLLKEKICSICQQFDECDIDTLPVDELAESIIQNLQETIWEDHELTNLYNLLIAQHTFTQIEELRLLLLEIMENLPKIFSENGRNHNTKVQIHTANEDYLKNYTEPLFLHKDKKQKISLQDIFIPPHYSVGPYSQSSIPQRHLKQYLIDFINLSPKNVLFIEGDAGVGKSSLVSYLIHSHLHGEQRLFADREIICIRLRDVTLSAQEKAIDYSLSSDIENYLQTDYEILKKYYNDAIIILDGFDELYMLGLIESIQNHVRDVCEFFQDFKLIITTRPQYLNINRLDIPYEYITLHHFNQKQRKDWVKQYRTLPNDSDAEIALSYIEHIDNKEAEGICDTPMALYMIAAGKITEDATKNIWALYHQIFYQEIPEAKFNDNKSHKIRKYRNEIYLLTSEIAYKMYTLQKLYIRENEILEIIKKMNFDSSQKDVKRICKECYALCGYWKQNTQQGAVEFYHNNIRDFFLCEKILYEMEKLYQDFCLDSNISDFTPFIEAFNELFSFSKIDSKVLKFIHSRILYEKEKNELSKCIEIESKEKFFSNIFQSMLTFGGIYHYQYNSNKTKNLFQTIINILYSTLHIFLCILQIFRTNNEYIDLWYDVSKINNSKIFKAIFNELFHTINIKNLYIYLDVPSVDLSGCELDNLCLNHCNFQHAILHHCNLRYTFLQSAMFGYADLRHADLRNTHLQGAYLQYAKLQCANLQSSNLQHAHLESAQLQYANLESANLYDSYFNRAKLQASNLQKSILQNAHLEYSHLEDANLRYAHLEGANLTHTFLQGANLQYAYLEDAILPGDFSSPNQDEQIAHLKSLHIQGLEI